MPRRSRRVSLTDGDVELVAERLREVLPVAVLDVPEAPRTIDEVLSRLGDTRREQITRGAIALSGSSDKSSRAYKSARRRLERYTTTGGTERRRARPNALEQIVRTVRRPHLPTDRGLTVRMRADVVYAGTARTMPASGPQPIAPARLSAMRRHLRDGDVEAAARALLDEFVRVYGLVTDLARGGEDVLGHIEWCEVALDE